MKVYSVLYLQTLSCNGDISLLLHKGVFSSLEEAAEVAYNTMPESRGKNWINGDDENVVMYSFITFEEEIRIIPSELDVERNIC